MDITKYLNLKLPENITNKIIRDSLPSYDYIYELKDIITTHDYIEIDDFSKYYFNNFLEYSSSSDDDYYGYFPRNYDSSGYDTDNDDDRDYFSS
tara:strand:+ start:94 stop:375 length:282 start_codon:yes stop_codon:yes gene_type:complete